MLCIRFGVSQAPLPLFSLQAAAAAAVKVQGGDRRTN